jgi:hypothetical protein
MEARGEHIGRSAYIRDFCCICGEPIRVVALEEEPCCSECDPRHREEWTSHRKPRHVSLTERDD